MKKLLIFTILAVIFFFPVKNVFGATIYWDCCPVTTLEAGQSSVCNNECLNSINDSLNELYVAVDITEVSPDEYTLGYFDEIVEGFGDYMITNAIAQGFVLFVLGFGFLGLFLYKR